MSNLLALVPIVLLLACSESDTATPARAIEVDSSGIAVVSNPVQGSWGGGRAWTVEEVLSIGSTAGDFEQFGRIVGLDVDRADRVYVADGQSQTVRVYDPDGTFVRRLGRPGSGPGELGAPIMGVFLIGDTVLVPDGGNGRLSRFSTDGTFLGSTRLDLSQGEPLRWDIAIGPRLVAQTRPLTLGDTAGTPRGDAVVTIDPRVPMDTVVVLPVGGGAQITGGQPAIELLGSEPVWDADDAGRLITAMSDAWRFEIRDLVGEVRRVFTRPYEERPVSAEDKRVLLDRYRTRLLRQGAPVAVVDQLVGLVEVSDRYPAFAALVWGPHGSVWVQQERTGGEVATDDGGFDLRDLPSPVWSVFDAQGHYLGDLYLPATFRPMRVMGDLLYGVARDELDVETVRVFRVHTG